MCERYENGKIEGESEEVVVCGRAACRQGVCSRAVLIKGEIGNLQQYPKDARTNLRTLINGAKSALDRGECHEPNQLKAAFGEVLRVLGPYF
ncbi:MAG: hypothetical protein ACD_52C00236G0003 [uncultured bacterium]|nr:MAG: hypothetical protein ACD_52C00236G0003 [uncultured bacterium]